MSKILLPLYIDEHYLASVPANAILFTRFKNDYQDNCFLFHEIQEYTISQEESEKLSKKYHLCYLYDMFHFENREFTIEGYEEINSDIKNIISSGFKYILVSNPYIIELLCNEYSGGINVIVSSQLEINSSHSKIFFDVLNSTSNISHIIVSQNHLHKKEFDEMKRTFDVELIVELDRLISDNQIVHEHFYNMLYGYYNNSVKSNLIEYISDNQKYFRRQDLVEYYDESISYKLGELNLNQKILQENLSYLINGKLKNINVIDYDLWLGKDCYNETFNTGF